MTLELIARPEVGDLRVAIRPEPLVAGSTVDMRVALVEEVSSSGSFCRLCLNTGADPLSAHVARDDAAESGSKVTLATDTVHIGVFAL